jgi:hypothetical protein
MRKVLATSVRREFASQLSQWLPQFVRDLRVNVPSECHVYRDGSVGPEYLGLMLQTHETWDAFTIEASGSREGQYPAVLSPLFLPRAWPDDPAYQKADPLGNGFRFRISTLWQPGDSWWCLVPPHPNESVMGPTQEPDHEDHVNRMIPLMMSPDPPIADAHSRVTPCVTDAIHKVTTYVLPYFREVLEVWRTRDIPNG